MNNNLQRRFFAHLDLPLLAALGILIVISLTLIYSASGGSIDRVMGQFVNIVVAFVAQWLVANMPLHYLIRSAVPIYILGMALLLSVALFGDIQNGARRWLNIGVTTIQPSELMKIAVPLMMAWYFERHEATLGWKNYIVASFILAVPFYLILRQPDLGTALLICASGFYVLFLAGLNWRIIAGLAISAIASAPFIWQALHGYQRQRILMLLDPSQDPLGKGYHTIQGMIAVGSGGVLGKGYLNGTQTHLEFLPERTTDFIFAVFSEEFGLLGNIILLAIYTGAHLRGGLRVAGPRTHEARHSGDPAPGMTV